MAIIRRASKYLLVLIVVLGVGYWGWARFKPRSIGANARDEVFQAELSAMEDVLVASGQVRPARRCPPAPARTSHG